MNVLEKKDYNEIYKNEEYQKHYKESLYVNMWHQVILFAKRFKVLPKILEVGCGTGQLAHFLYDEGFTDYHGFDYSEEAIKIAKTKSPQSFSIGDATDPKEYEKDYSLIIATEVFEHIPNDADVIRNFKSGTPIIFSVPTFPCKGHYRWFKTKMDVMVSYLEYIKVNHIVKFSGEGSTAEWFVVLGVVK